jgi:hypothetical protein
VLIDVDSETGSANAKQLACDAIETRVIKTTSGVESG